MIQFRVPRTHLVALLVFTTSTTTFASAHARKDAPAAPYGAESSHSLHRNSRSAQRAELTHAWFVGAWETRTTEFGRDVRIIWTLWDDGRLAYDFVVDGVASRGSDGTWGYRDGIMREDWVRPDGSTGMGRGTVEKIDDNTLRLTIIDNGSAEYQGLSRIYKRLGPPQVVDCGCIGPRMH